MMTGKERQERNDMLCTKSTQPQRRSPRAPAARVAAVIWLRLPASRWCSPSPSSLNVCRALASPIPACKKRRQISGYRAEKYFALLFAAILPLGVAQKQLRQNLSENTRVACCCECEAVVSVFTSLPSHTCWLKGQQSLWSYIYTSAPFITDPARMFLVGSH